MTPHFASLVAPQHWRVIDFISDLHLQASEPATHEAWQRYMQQTRADAVFVLGDLFEVWVGDDVVSPPKGDGQNGSNGFEAHCAAVLKAAAVRTALFFMHGNRDFLVGQSLMARCGATLLQDPTTLLFGGQRWLLSHGDQLCLSDTAYLAFRATVRSAAWQAEFLARPLAQRVAIAQDLRRQSEARKRTDPVFSDVDAQAASNWLTDADACTLIHGHTHRPGLHVLAPGQQRVVLCDWDGAAHPPRTEVLRLKLSECRPSGSDGQNARSGSKGECEVTLNRIDAKSA